MKRNRKKITIATLASIVAIVILCLLISTVRNKYAVSIQQTNSQNKLEFVASRVDEVAQEEEDIRQQYDEFYTSKTDTIALMARKMNAEYTSDFTKNLCEVLDVDNCIVTDAYGNVISSAYSPYVDFTSARFNQLRAIMNNPENYSPITVDVGSAMDGEYVSYNLRYYASKIDDEHMGIIAVDTTAIENNVQINTSLSATLQDIRVGQDGFVLAVSAQTYDVLNDKVSDYVGQNVINLGMEASQLTDGYNGFVQFGSNSYYASVMLKDGVFYICMVPETEITGSTTNTILFGALTLAVIILIMISYYYFLQKEHVEMDEELSEKRKYNKKLGGKLLMVAAVGTLVVFGCTYYLQTLFVLSQQSITNSRRVDEAIETIAENDNEIATLTEEYNNMNLEKCQLLSYVLKNTEAYGLTQEYMTELKEALNVEQVWYFDTNAKAIATDQNFWGFVLSTNEKDQSYAFRSILNGTCEYLIQDAQVNDMGEMTQLIGVAMLDDNHKTKGLVQVAVYPERLEKKLENTSLSSVLKGIQTGNNGFAFAVNKESLTFDYYPDDTINGQSAELYGMKEADLRSGFSDFLTIDGTKYYAASSETATDYIYIAVPQKSLNTITLPVSVIITAYAALVLFALWYGLSLETQSEVQEAIDRRNEDMIDVNDGRGKTIKTRSILSRFSHTGIPWDNQTAGQKMFTVTKYILTLLSIIFVILLLNADKVFGDESLILYVLKGTWQKRINIFAITSSIIAIIVVFCIGTLVREFLGWLSTNMNAKAITIVRMLDNFIKFAMIIGLAYYCLGMIGVDTSTLVASAGILTLIVGLGANSLVNDIIAGLFIVLEGEFQVGDIVTIGGFRGTVMEIGIRCTKVKESSGNIKIFSNRSVGDVLNMTKDYSVVSIDMTVKYTESIEYVENVLQKEFPRIKKKFPAIVDGPFYKGVSELGGDSMSIRIICKSTEENRGQLDRDLRREFMLVFDKYGVNNPDAHISLDDSGKNHTVSAREVHQAEKFVQEQNEESKDIHEEEN